jgi:hypothetical protein
MWVRMNMSFVSSLRQSQNVAAFIMVRAWSPAFGARKRNMESTEALRCAFPGKFV